jgi:6,7-dimethyl-8-ribityllumazine synthase
MSEIERIEGQLVLDPPGRFGVVASRFNGIIVESMLSACIDALRRHGTRAEDITLAKVPGAHEIPLVVKRMAASGRYEAMIGLGAVIRGATPHFEHVAAACAEGLARLSLDHGIPVIFGVLTVDSVEQAIERAGSKSGNRGADAAAVAIEMVSLLRKLGS